MLKKAMKEGYIVPAFNFANFEILRGILLAVEECRSPMILQVSESAMNYFTDEILEGVILGIRKKKLPISIHLDHGKNFDVVKRAIKLGFDSVMIDGSTLEYKDNVKLTRSVVNFAHKKNVSVEGELGVLAIAEDDEKKSSERRFTSPQQAKDFVEKTGVDCLAVSIGTNHGINKYVGEPKIRYDILRKIQEQIPSVPIVLHGASLVEQKYIDIINSNGGKIEQAIGNSSLLARVYKTNVCKINMDTDFRIANTAGVRKCLSEDLGVYCPRVYGKFAIELIKKCAIDRIKKICHSNDKF